MKTRIARHVAIYLFIALTGYGIGACRQNVILNPGEDDLVILNDCVVSACNYPEAVKTQHTLEKNFWAKILLVRYVNHPAGHAYCVWEKTARSMDTMGTPAVSLFRFAPETQDQLRLFWLRNYRSILTIASQSARRIL